MDINFVQNIVFAVIFAYLIIRFFKGFAVLMQYLFTKIIVYLREKRLNKNVDSEYIDYLKDNNNVK